MQTKEVMELSKQIRQKMKDIDGFGKFGHHFFCVPSWLATIKKFVFTHMICLLYYMLNAIWRLTRL
jgi:hypothetical protein